MSASPPAQSNAQLAALLTNTFAELDQTKSERDAALQRAQQAEHLLQVATSAAPSASSPSGSSSNTNDTISALQAVNATQQRSIADLNARLKAINEAWSAFDHWSASLDSRSLDARNALRRTIAGLVSGSEPDASSPLPLRDVPPFQLPALSRKSSRTAGMYHHLPLQIPPGAPGGRPTSQAGVPANLPPVPLAGRVRQREDSLPRRRSEDEPPPSARRDPSTTGAGDPSTSEERSHRHSADDDAVVDRLSEGERQRKRLRADPGPAPSASVPPPTRRDRAAPFTESPRSSNTQFSPQFTFPHPQAYPPPQQPGQPHAYSAEQQIRHRSSDPSAHPAHLHIGDGPDRPPYSFARHHHPRHGSDSTIAITPTSAATTAASAGPASGSKDSYLPPFSHRHSRSGGDTRMDSLGDGTSMMIGELRMDSPPPMDPPPPQRRYSDRPPPSYSDRPEERRRRESDRRMDTESMDVDDGPELRRTRKGTGGGDDKNSVDEFLINSAIDPTGEDGEERDQLRDDDREMSPMSVSVSRHHRHQRNLSNLSATEMERWKERDRQRELERSGEVEALGGEQHVHYPGANGLVKIKEKSGDKFRHYLYNNPSPTTSPHLAPSPHHNQTFPMTQILSLTGGHLTPTGRRGTIAGVVTTPSEREFNYASRASFQAQHARRHSNEGGPPSSNISHPSLVAPPTPGAPLSAGSSTSILFPHSQQPRHTGPGPAVKPTLNAQGQRTCRQCGQPGRYKEGKCVEKWGPGPAGPGTVCDRCRKKMKRVERRGTQDAATLGQHIPLVPLASNQQPQAISPRQYYNSAYPRSPGGEPQHREYTFQTPLSASSATWNRGERSAKTASVITSPPQSSKPREREQVKPPKEKRRAPSYSESPSPAPDEEGGSAKSASHPRSNEDDVPPSAGGAATGSPISTTQRKNSGDTAQSAEMEHAAEVLMVELDEDASPSGTTVKDKDVEDDADADGDLEDAVGEEEDADADIAVAESGQDPQQRPSAVPASRKHSRTMSSTTTSPTRDKEQNLKPSWVKLEDDSITVA